MNSMWAMPVSSILVLIMAVIITVGAGFFLPCKWAVTRVQRIRGKKEKVTKTPGLLKAYIQARHQKVCPTLTYMEDN